MNLEIPKNKKTINKKTSHKNLIQKKINICQEIEHIEIEKINKNEMDNKYIK
jgi:hypothetical protein